MNCNPFIPHARPPHIVKCCTFSWFHWLFTLAAHPLDRSMDCGTVSWWIHVERGTSSAFCGSLTDISPTQQWYIRLEGETFHIHPDRFEGHIIWRTSYWPLQLSIDGHNIPCLPFVRCHFSFHSWATRFPVVNSRYYLETCWVHGEWVGAMFMDFSNISLLNPGASLRVTHWSNDRMCQCSKGGDPIDPDTDYTWGRRYLPLLVGNLQNLKDGNMKEKWICVSWKEAHLWCQTQKPI